MQCYYRIIENYTGRWWQNKPWQAADSALEMCILIYSRWL